MSANASLFERRLTNPSSASVVVVSTGRGCARKPKDGNARACLKKGRHTSAAEALLRRLLWTSSTNRSEELAARHLFAFRGDQIRTLIRPTKTMDYPSRMWGEQIDASAKSIR